MKSSRYGSAALALALLCSTLLVACNEEAAAPTEAARPVLTHVVGKTGDSSLATYSGEVRARVDAPLAFRVAGKIIGRRVDVGARVKAGDELARLDPADNALAAANANAQLAAAAAERDFAKSELTRYTDLRDRHFVSQAVYDQKANTLATAVARYNAVQAQAAVSRNQSEYTVLRADAAGVIDQVQAEVGQVVSAGQPVFRLARDTEKEVAISVPESRMKELTRSDSAQVTLWASDGSGKPYPGRIREIAPVADSTTRTYPVRVSIVGAGNEVLLGMTANVSFHSSRSAPTLTIPLGAIFQKDGKPAVWIVGQDSRVSLRPVSVSAFTERGAEISAGLQGNERIVAAGVHKLIPGEKINAI